MILRGDASHCRHTQLKGDPIPALCLWGIIYKHLGMGQEELEEVAEENALIYFARNATVTLIWISNAKWMKNLKQGLFILNNIQPWIEYYVAPQCGQMEIDQRKAGINQSCLYQILWKTNAHMTTHCATYERRTIEINMFLLCYFYTAAGLQTARGWIYCSQLHSELSHEQQQFHLLVWITCFPIKRHSDNYRPRHTSLLSQHLRQDWVKLGIFVI